jgi:hypothetical protein
MIILAFSNSATLLSITRGKESSHLIPLSYYEGVPMRMIITCLFTEKIDCMALPPDHPNTFPGCSHDPAFTRKQSINGKVALYPSCLAPLCDNSLPATSATLFPANKHALSVLITFQDYHTWHLIRSYWVVSLWVWYSF